MNSSLIDDRIYCDKNLMSNYRIISKLGEGAFGSVYKTINIATKKEVALKIQFFRKDKKGTKESALVKQMAIYNILKGIPGIPEVYSLQKWQFGYYMEMEVLVSSLEGERKNKLTFQQLKTYLIQILNILKRIHAKSIIHQDLKPQNIMKNSEGKIMLIDFGLSANYNPVNSEIQQKSKKQEAPGFIGTPRYASLAAHQGKIQKQKDDVQSLLYVFGYLLMNKTPWSNLKLQQLNRLKIIYKYKKMKNKHWFSQCGKPFLQSYNYISELTDKEQFDYGYIIKLFQYHRQSLAIHPQFKSQQRKISAYTDAPFIINVHEIKNNPLKPINYNIQRSNSNFSTKAQDWDKSKQTAQLLAHHLFISKQSSQQQLDSSGIGQPIENEPNIKDFDSLGPLSFKNPFKDNHA